MSNDLLNETDVAKKLRVSLACLRRWRLEKRGPTFIKIGPLVRYRQEDLHAWLESLPTGGIGAARQEVQPEVSTPLGASRQLKIGA